MIDRPDVSGLSDKETIDMIKAWVSQFVIGYHLCPFAASPFVKNLIRYKVVTASEEQRLLESVSAEIDLLQTTPADELSTTIIILCHLWSDFYEYNHGLDLVDGVIAAKGMEGVIQVASFHPNYQFAGVKPQDASNFTNRSPLPLLHLIREDDISHARDSYPDIEGIPSRNIETMEKLGFDELDNNLKLLMETPQ